MERREGIRKSIISCQYGVSNEREYNKPNICRSVGVIVSKDARFCFKCKKDEL